MTNFMHNLGTRTQTRQRGTSLVEVLVVLVILVLGIFSIARLFPGGFFTIRSAENNTFADRLAQAQLEMLKENGASLLNGVYVYNDQTPGFDPSVNLASLQSGYPAASPEAAYNDVNKARYISGENFMVPAAGLNGVPTHVLNYGPAHIPASTRNGALPTPTDEGFDLVSAPWTPQTGSSQLSPSDPSDPTLRVDSPADILQPGKPTYLVDYTNGKIAVPPANYAQNFTLVITTTGGSNSVTYIVPLVVPASNPNASPNSSSVYNGGWFAPGDTTLGYAPANSAPAVGTAFVTGSTMLVRPVRFIAQDTSTAYTNLRGQADPYTCELAVGASVQVGAPDEYMGVLALNPGLAGKQVSASYNTVDWHIIHEDVDVPSITTTFGSDTSVPNAPIRLTLNHLRRVGDVLSNQTTPSGVGQQGGANTSSVYPGLFTGGTTPLDIVLLDTDTGQMQGLNATDPTYVFDAENPAAGSTAATNMQYAVSYENGRITLPAQYPVGFSGPHKHLRVFYAGDYGWAVALQKNPSLYARNDAGLTIDPNTHLYKLQAGQYAVDVANQAIYFPLTDEGQSIELDDVSYTDSNGKVYRTGSVTLAISSSENSLYPDITDGNGQTISGIRQAGDLSTNLATALTVDSGATLDTAKGIRIGVTRGISARAVVIWKERDQWKSRTVGTILNRS